MLEDVIAQRDHLSTASNDLKRRRQEGEAKLQFVRIEKRAAAEKIKAL